MRILSLILLFGCAHTGNEAPQPAAQAVLSLAELTFTQLDGAPLPPDAIAGKAVLFVNVASRCGYTRQYDGLQALYEEKRDAGLVIVGVPCNQFLGQEPGTPEEIATFCRMNYGVTFPLLEKQDVNGTDRSPLYQWLVSSPVGAGEDVGWNFEKFVVDREGRVVARFGASLRPDDPALRAAVDQALGG